MPCGCRRGLCRPGEISPWVQTRGGDATAARAPCFSGHAGVLGVTRSASGSGRRRIRGRRFRGGGLRGVSIMLRGVSGGFQLVFALFFLFRLFIQFPAAFLECVVWCGHIGGHLACRNFQMREMNLMIWPFFGRAGCGRNLQKDWNALRVRGYECYQSGQSRIRRSPLADGSAVCG